MTRPTLLVFLLLAVGCQPEPFAPPPPAPPVVPTGPAAAPVIGSTGWMTGVPTPTGFASSNATAISNTNLVAGYSSDRLGFGQAAWAVRWKPTVLGPGQMLPNWSGLVRLNPMSKRVATAAALGAFDDYVVGWSTDDQGNHVPVFWRYPDATPIPLPMAGWSSGEATAVGAGPVIVGWVRSSSGSKRAFRYRPGTAVLDLLKLSGSSVANGISEDGKSVTGCVTAPPGPGMAVTSAFVDGPISFLAPSPLVTQVNNSCGLAVNNTGTMGGYFEYVDASGAWFDVGTFATTAGWAGPLFFDRSINPFDRIAVRVQAITTGGRTVGWVDTSWYPEEFGTTGGQYAWIAAGYDPKLLPRFGSGSAAANAITDTCLAVGYSDSAAVLWGNYC
ncbi:MAG: hypothetical protein AB7L66_16415 [Gemmatimonadales bacterium]